MLTLGNKVRLTAREREMLQVYCGEDAAPETVADAKAWLLHAADCTNPECPEERLMAAVFRNMADELQGEPTN